MRCAIAIGNSARTLNASTSSLMVATAPVLTALAAARIYSERIRPLGWAAIALEFSGILVLTLGHGALSINVGLLWAFLSALSMCCYNLVQRRLTKTYSALSVTAYGIFAAAILQMFCLPDAFVQLAAVPLPVFFGLLYLGIFSSALGYLVWSHALSLAQKTSDVTNWMFLNPLMTTLFGVLLLGEFPDLPTLLGGGIILTGLLLFHRFTQETHPANGSSPH
ncbi:MAG: EamA family transporter [Oscillospiraceae bacterium]